MNRLFDIANRSSVSVYVYRFLHEKTPHFVIEVQGFFGQAPTFDFFICVYLRKTLK